MINKKSFLLCCLFSPMLCISQSLNKEIENLKKDAALKHATWSIYVVNSITDSVVADYNSNTSLVPASTMKIVTTSAALGMLGSDYVFKTQLQYDGIFDSISGILKGNVFIVGGGDPTLESSYFKEKKDTLSTIEKWALMLKGTGIKRIEGAIIGDAEIFEDNSIPSQWIWGDIGNYFGAGASGLTYHDNKYIVNFKSGSVGSKTTINSIQPSMEDLQFINNVTAGGNDDSAFIYGSPYSFYRKAEGTIPPNKKNYEVEGSIPDPALSCAQALESALKKLNIAISQKATTAKKLKETGEYITTGRKNMFASYSPTLDKIVYWTNMKSINLYAEHLLKFMSYRKTGFGSESKGTQLVTAYWKDRGVDVSGFTMVDGCGLARANVITTKTETQILCKMTKDKNFDVFYKSFPIAGKSGSLSGLCEGTFAENNLRAKSGYISMARGYAGYVKNRKGQMLCFSVIANNYECSPTEMKKKLERLLIAIAETK
jgi:D-alanyl-D-alanine carboxypeptidase/D-alanyl-D-alanine-endopeptidase (penicillin-binding protein 4)